MLYRSSKFPGIKIIILLIFSALFFPGCGFIQEGFIQEDRPQSPKYVFLFIGDGMGLSQITAAEIYLYSLKNQDAGRENLSFSGFPVLGMTATFSSNSYLTDSAASGTAIASGYKTKNGKINISGDETRSFIPLSEAAQSAGRKIGILSCVSLDHATPACYFARTPHRSRYYHISLQMAESGFDFFGGGGLKQPAGRDGGHPDARCYAREKGYSIIGTKEEFQRLKPGTGKVWAINQNLTRHSALPYEIDRPPEDLTLADFTRKAISMLDNPSGFFIMVEGGKIDWACHDNDAAAAIHEMLAFSSAVEEAVDFYHEHRNETLIVVASDHETGGMLLGSGRVPAGLKLNLLSYQKMSLDLFNQQIVKPYLDAAPEETRRLDDLWPDIQKTFGFSRSGGHEQEALRQKAEQRDPVAQDKLKLVLSPEEWKELEAALSEPGGYSLAFAAVKILNDKAGISWGSGGHTALPVPVFALGAGSEIFQGSYDNTDIAKKLFGIMGLPFPQPVPLKEIEAETSSQ